MKYTKPSLTCAEQADLILSRGLVADRDRLIHCLSKVNYYRLSAYWYPFRLLDSDDLKPGTKFDTVWEYYTFDRQLRLIVMDAIERVEVAIRTQLVNLFTLNHGAFGHLDPNNFKKIPSSIHATCIEHISDETKKSAEPFVRHFKMKYDEEADLPFWMACELMSFGQFVRMYEYFFEKKELSREYAVDDTVMHSWLRSLNYVRNICAHHGRLWNRELAVSPKIPRGQVWTSPIRISDYSARVFSILTILKYMLSFSAPQSKWMVRLEFLLNGHPGIPKGHMGFPENWKDCPIWQ